MFLFYIKILYYNFVTTKTKMVGIKITANVVFTMCIWLYRELFVYNYKHLHDMQPLQNYLSCLMCLIMLPVTIYNKVCWNKRHHFFSSLENQEVETVVVMPFHELKKNASILSTKTLTAMSRSQDDDHDF